MKTKPATKQPTKKPAAKSGKGKLEAQYRQALIDRNATEKDFKGAMTNLKVLSL